MTAWPDIAVANDSWPNFLFLNKHDGTFEDVSLMSGIAASEDGRYEAGMGIDAADVDGDGWQDVYITHLDFELNRLYRNSHDGTFTDETFRSGLGNKAVLLSGVAMKFLDYDNDGWNDILQLNGSMLDNALIPASAQLYDHSPPVEVFDAPSSKLLNCSGAAVESARSIAKSSNSNEKSRGAAANCLSSAGIFSHRSTIGCSVGLLWHVLQRSPIPSAADPGHALRITPIIGTRNDRRRSRAKKYATAENFFADSLSHTSHAAGSVSLSACIEILFVHCEKTQPGIIAFRITSAAFVASPKLYAMFDCPDATVLFRPTITSLNSSVFFPANLQHKRSAGRQRCQIHMPARIRVCRRLFRSAANSMEMAPSGRPTPDAYRSVSLKYHVIAKKMRQPGSAEIIDANRQHNSAKNTGRIRTWRILLNYFIHTC